jgi:predicted acylesterase/phospholipase RssA
MDSNEPKALTLFVPYGRLLLIERMLKAAIYLLALIYAATAMALFDLRYMVLAVLAAFGATYWTQRSMLVRISIWSLSLIAPLTFWYWWTNGSIWLNVCWLIISALIGWGLLHFTSKSTSTRSARALLFIVYSSLAFWVSCSTYYHFSRPAGYLAIDPARLAKRTDNWPEVKVAIALSGGGYRAAFMHAGVLNALEQLGVKVHAISAVSGGAIIGSFYAAGGDPRHLAAASRRNAFDLKRRMLDFPNFAHLALKLEIPFIGLRLNPFSNFSRTDVQAQLIDDIFLHGTTWDDLATHHAPGLLLGTTDLVHGAAVGFGAGGVLHRPVKTQYAHSDYLNVGQQEESKTLSVQPRSQCLLNGRLADVVAASGAFPGAFAPVNPRCKTLWSKDDELSSLLVDGGVVDNLGVALLYAAGSQSAGSRYDVLIVSDAGASLPNLDTTLQFGAGPGSLASSSITQLLRAVDVMYAAGQTLRLGSSDYEPAKFLLSPAVYSVDPTDHMLLPQDKADRAHGTYLLALKTLVNLGKKYGGSLLAIPVTALTEDEAFLTPEIVSRRRALLRRVLQCCETARPNQYEPYLPDNLAVVLANDFADCVDAFERTGTLEIDITHDDAERIYRLGQYLVVLNWDSLQAAIGDFEKYHKSDVHLKVAVVQPANSKKDIGSTGVIEFRVRNTGSHPSTAVELHSDLPSNLLPTSFKLDVNSSSSCILSQQRLMCLLGDIPPDGERIVSVNVKLLRLIQGAEKGSTEDDDSWEIIVGVASSEAPSRVSSREVGAGEFHISP